MALAHREDWPAVLSGPECMGMLANKQRAYFPGGYRMLQAQDLFRIT